jgi:hypothetical protein
MITITRFIAQFVSKHILPLPLLFEKSTLGEEHYKDKEKPVLEEEQQQLQVLFENA